MTKIDWTFETGSPHMDASNIWTEHRKGFLILP